MSRIRSGGTAPERRMGELLRLLFPDEEIIEQPSGLPGRPDWWLPGLRMACFADGCFFHACPQHFIMPLNNQVYWQGKVEGNRQRDREVNRKLRDMGILPVRIWEHDLRQDLMFARRKLRRAARQQREVLGLKEGRAAATAEPRESGAEKDVTRQE